MKFKKLPLLAALIFATGFIVACGDDKDPRISDADALCLKMIKNGGTCGGNTNSSSTAVNTTSTVTVTVTNSGS